MGPAAGRLAAASVALAFLLSLGGPCRAEESPPAWLATDRAVQVGPDGTARSLYQPEFRNAVWLGQQLGLHALEGLRVELVTPWVPGPRVPKARSEPPPVPGRLLLSGSTAAVTRARQLLRRLDAGPRAVLVSLLVTEVARHRRNARGGSLVFDKAMGPGGDAALFRSFTTTFEPEDYLRSTLSGVTPFEGTTLAFGNDNISGSGFEYALRMLQKEGEAEFLAWPNLLVNEGTAASMTATHTVPQVLLQSDAEGSISVRGEETGLKLRVTPRRIGKDDAELDLDVWMRLPEEVTDAASVPGTLRLKLRQVTTRVTVQDGQPLLLGGLVLRRNDRARRGLPRPRALSALDPLHSSQVGDAAETEILFLVRARVVPPGRSPAELDPATYRAWTAGRGLPDAWHDARDPSGRGGGQRASEVSR